MIPVVDQEFKSIIPPLTPEEFEQLEQNIAESRKCHDPLILWEGIIIDGHNRFDICLKHGIEFQIKEIPLASREEAKVWILENQLGRRNLSDVARMEIALLKAEMLREKAKKNITGGDRKSGKSSLTSSSKPEIEPVHVRKETAQNAGVGEMTLYNYMQIKKHGSPELLAKVRSGELQVGTAHRLLTKEILKQLRGGDKMLKFIRDSMPETGYKNADPEIHDKLINLSLILRQLLANLAKGGYNEAS